MLRKLALHTSVYSIGSLLAALSGFISFPIITRYLSIEAYGYLNLVSVALAILCGLSKAGLQKSVVRFFGEIHHGQSAFTIQSFYATSLLGMAFTGIIVTSAWVIICFVSWYFSDDKSIYFLFLMTAILVFVRTLHSSCQNFFVAKNKSAIMVLSNLANRYISLVAVVIVLMYYSTALGDYYLAIIVVEIGVLAAFLAYTLKAQPFSVKDFNPALFKQMLCFGLPLIGLEISSQILSLGDRYIIQYFHGAEMTGIYSAPYNLCEYLNSIVLMSISTAIMPVYMEIWAKDGAKKTSHFISEVLYYYVFLTIPIIFGFSMIGRDFITLMASEKYQESAIIIPYVISGMLLNGAISIFAAGLYIKRNTGLIMKLMLIAALFNIVLNILLIPLWHIIGAACSTLMSYLLLAAMSYYYGNRELEVRIPLNAIFTSGTISAVMVLAMSLIQAEHLALRLLLQVIIGILVFLVLTLACIKPFREKLALFIHREP